MKHFVKKVSSVDVCDFRVPIQVDLRDKSYNSVRYLYEGSYKIISLLFNQQVKSKYLLEVAT